MKPSLSKGFTLLELLVGIVILGFILAGLTQGVRYGLHAADSQQRMVDAKSEMDAVDRALRRLIVQADPGSAHDGPTLHGTEGRLLFVSVLPAAIAGPVAQPANIAIGIDAAHRLVLRWTPHWHAHLFGPPPVPQEVELLTGIDGVHFAYWANGWHDSWDDAALPALIRIRIVFPPGDPRHWPDIVVAPVRQRLT
jgi:general secretion pathway protein J